MGLEKQSKSRNLYFKGDGQDQNWMFPPNLGDLIDKDDPVRFVNHWVNELDVSDILAQYKPGGTSIYHPKVLIKLLIYGYIDRVYSSRDLEQCCRENIKYMWLCGMNQPDHVTIANFRSQKLQSKVKDIFKEVLKEAYTQGLITLETQTVDGTKVESVANKYTHIWIKNVLRHKGNLEQKIECLLDEIEEHLQAEDSSLTREKKEIGDDQEGFEQSPVPVRTSERQEDEKQTEDSTLSDDTEGAAMKDQVSEDAEKRSGENEQEELASEKVANKLKSYGASKDKHVKRKIKNIKEKLLPKLIEYEKKQSTLGDRNSYSKTDPDATFMRMKDDVMGNGQLKPAYNMQVSSENQFIVNYTLHQNANDATCYKAHTTDTLQLLTSVDLPEFKYAHGDSIYGTEENFSFIEEEQIGNYLKYPSFHSEKKKKYQNDIKNGFYYSAELDSVFCPMGQRMQLKSEQEVERKSGFKTNIKIYQAKNCDRCPLRGVCLNKKARGNRTFRRNEKLERYRNTARENLESDLGLKMRSNRSVDIEPVFGHLKSNRRFNRFTHVGIKKIQVELGLLAIAHNLRKLIANMDENTFIKVILGLIRYYVVLLHLMKSNIIKSCVTLILTSRATGKLQVA